MPPKLRTNSLTQATPSGTPPEFDPVLTRNPGRASEMPVQDDDSHCPPPPLIHDNPLQHLQHPFTVRPVEPQRTHFEITWQECPANLVTPSSSKYRLSGETLSPIHLQRMVDHSMPMRLSAAHFPQLEDIAGSPVSSTAQPRFDCATGKFVDEEDLHELHQLSPISSYHSFGPLPTPEFDSTGHVMRLAPPGETQLPLLSAQRACVTPPFSTVAQRSEDDDALQSPQGVAHSSAAVALPLRGENLEEFDENQANCAPPTLSGTLLDAWQTQMQTPPNCQSAPGSAPAVLSRTTAGQRELEAHDALDSNDATAVADDFSAVQLVASQDAMP